MTFRKFIDRIPRSIDLLRYFAIATVAVKSKEEISSLGTFNWCNFVERHSGMFLQRWWNIDFHVEEHLLDEPAIFSLYHVCEFSTDQFPVDFSHIAFSHTKRPVGWVVASSQMQVESVKWNFHADGNMLSSSPINHYANFIPFALHIVLVIATISPSLSFSIPHSLFCDTSNASIFVPFSPYFSI